MSIELRSMVRAHELDIPGANKHIGPLMTEQLADVRHMPWLHGSTCFGPKPWASPFWPEVTAMNAYIDQVVLDETGRPHSDMLYLDIENPMGRSHPWCPNRGEIYRNCMLVAKQALGRKGAGVKVFFYSLLQKAFRAGRQPEYLWHDLIESYADAFGLSLYGCSDRASFSNAVEADMKMADRYLGFYNYEYRLGRPCVLFVWGLHKEKGLYPPELWEAYMKHLIGLCRDGDIICWFSGDETRAFHKQYATQIQIDLIENRSRRAIGSQPGRDVVEQLAVGGDHRAV